MIFATNSYLYLLNEITKKKPSLEVGLLEKKSFPDGEIYHRIKSDVKNKEVILIGGTETDSATLETYDLACSISQLGAKKIIIIIPYFGYSTMERSIKDGEVVKAKTRARLFSSIPQCVEGNKIVLFDLHSEGIPYYFEGNTKTKHIYCKSLVEKGVLSIIGSNKKENYVLGSTDAGRAKWVSSLSRDFGMSSAFVYKRRLSGSSSQITGVNADVLNKDVIIYDDMIRTGGSLLNAAQAYKDAGANKIFVICTHLIIPDDSLSRILSSPLIEGVSCTNTHPRSELLLGRGSVFCISDLIIEEFLNDK